MTGKQLKQLRERAGWTQVQLADTLGYHEKQVRNWESGVTPIRPVLAEIIKDKLKEKS